MGFYGFDADAQVIGNLLVQTTRHNALEHLCFACGEFGHQGVSVGGGEVVTKGFTRLVKHALDQAHQVIFFKRLLNEIHGTFFHGVDGHGYIAVTGDKNNGQG